MASSSLKAVLLTSKRSPMLRTISYIMSSIMAIMYSASWWTVVTSPTRSAAFDDNRHESDMICDSCISLAQNIVTLSQTPQGRGSPKCTSSGGDTCSLMRDMYMRAGLSAKGLRTLLHLSDAGTQSRLERELMLRCDFYAEDF